MVYCSRCSEQTTVHTEHSNHNHLLSNTTMRDGCDADDDFDGTNSCFVDSNLLISKPLTLKKLLQHFAAYTGQKKSHMTYLLKLLKKHQPPAAYESLPSTGTQLMSITRNDKWKMSSHPSSSHQTINNLNMYKRLFT